MRLLPHQDRVLTSRKQEIFLGGGIGAGKTAVGSLWTVKKITQTPRDVYGLIVSNTYSQLYDTTVRAFYSLLESANIAVQPRQLPRSRGPSDILIHNGDHWVRILLRSLDHYDKLSGLEIGFYWVDECWLTKPEAIDVLNGRLRDRRMTNRQALFTTTLDSPDSWMFSRFVENHNPDLQDVVYAKTADNPNLPDGYLETLRSTYAKATFKRMVMAEWVTLDSEQIYNSFSREDNVRSVDYDPALPLLWSHDFNIGHGKPMSSVICQYHHNSQTFTVLDEIILERSDTNDAVSEFKARWAHHENGVVIYGDASGHARDTRSRATDYEILRRAGYHNQKVPRSNPAVRERHITVNALLRDAGGRVRVLVDPKCKTVIKGLESTALKKGSGYVEDDSNPSQHVTTALGYLLVAENPNRPSSTRQAKVRF
jgi:PBSX family phage terminase large subunit